MKKERYVVSPETARMLGLGHPWVVADQYTKRWRGGKVGEVVKLFDESGQFLATALLDPSDRIVARVLERGPMHLDVAWLRGKIQKASDIRRFHADLEGTNAYRLVNGEGDGLPGITVDRYGDYLMVQLYSAVWKPYLPLVVDVLQKYFPCEGIYEKARPQKTRALEAEGGGKKYGHLLAGRAAPGRLQVQESGMNFLVSLEEGLNTGLFFDQRCNRRDLMGRSKGKKVLNLFAYTGAFSVAAAVAGAKKVASVDISKTYLDWASENFGINHINPKRHEFIVGDCFKVLEDLRCKGHTYDIILMDPPSFSTTRKSRFTTSGGTAELVSAALPLLDSGGLLITSSNHQKVDLAAYLKELRRGVLQAKADMRVIKVAGQSEDFPYPLTFPEGRYLKYVISAKV